MGCTFLSQVRITWAICDIYPMYVFILTALVVVVLKRHTQWAFCSLVLFPEPEMWMASQSKSPLILHCFISEFCDPGPLGSRIKSKSESDMC